MRMYYLCRREDVSGASGIGHVAEIAEFDDGAVVVRWIADMNATGVASTSVFSSIDDLLKVHGHEGRTGVHLALDAQHIEQLETTVKSLREDLRNASELLEANGMTLPPRASGVAAKTVPGCGIGPHPVSEQEDVREEADAKL